MKLRNTTIAICFVSSIGFTKPTQKDVERIYHINERRWGKHDTEIGCAIDGSRDFVTLSISANAREIEIIYWQETPGIRSPGKPANYSALETNYFSVDDYNKGTLYFRGSRMKINRHLFVNGKLDSSLELNVDLWASDSKNRWLSRIEEPSKDRPQTIEGRLVCAQPASHIYLPQPNVPQHESKVTQEPSPSSAPISNEHLKKWNAPHVLDN